MDKILLVTTGHSPFDERIFNKFACSLSEAGFQTSILCSNEEINTTFEGISITGFDGNNLKKSEKITKLYEKIKKLNPDIIICSEPLPVLAANRYRRTNKHCKIIMDITEWYPEGYVAKVNGIKKYLYYVVQYLFNILMVNLADSLIIGEETKKKRYDLITPFKRKEIIGYYPLLKDFHYSPPTFDGKTLTLCYAGILNEERGFFTFLKVAKEISNELKETRIKLKLIGKFISGNDEKHFEELKKELNNIEIVHSGWVSYKKLSDELKVVDICFDLRKHNFVFDNSLPIKIFEYMAAGKPVVYTDIQPIKKHFTVNDVGFLVDPENIIQCKDIINEYINNPGLLEKHSKAGRRLIEEKFNWEMESAKLISYIKRTKTL